MKNSTQSGLSLFESLVALLLLAMIAAALANSLGLGVRILNQAQNENRDYEKYTARAQLRAHLKHVIRPEQRMTFQHRFTGSDIGFQFYSLAETRFNASATANRIDITVNENSLTMKLAILDPLGRTLETMEHILAVDFQQVEFSYFSVQLDEWLDKWQESSLLPDLVRIESLDKRRNWPTMIVSVSG